MTTMHCVRYKCTMPEATCVARQRRFEVQTRHGQYVPDPGCWNCDQGKAILKRFKKQEKKMEPVAIAAAASPPIPGESDKNTKTCSRCDAVFEGIAAINQNFYRAKRTRDGYETYCKVCRKLGRNEIRKAQKPVRPAPASPPKAPPPAPKVTAPAPTPDAPPPVVAPDTTELLRQVFGRCGCIGIMAPLEALATREMRTVAMQAAYMLRAMLHSTGEDQP